MQNVKNSLKEERNTVQVKRKSVMDNTEKGVLIEEYKTLRHEIDQNQRDNFHVMQLGITLTSAIWGLAYSIAIAEGRWMLLFAPCFVLIPLIMLITQRIRATWRIGRYIQKYIEPKLGYKWETINLQRKKNENSGLSRSATGFIKSFVGASVLPLVLIQIVCSYLSWIAVKQSGGSNLQEWATLACIVFIVVIIELRTAYEANHPEKYADWLLKDIE
jgi:magnesium-transporting ATPase (P-type)